MEGKKSQNSNYEEDSLNALFTYAAEGIVIVDSKGVILRCNPSSDKLFGYNTGELLGKNIDELLPDRLKDVHQHHRNTFNEHPKSRAMGKNKELFGKKKDGTEISLEISLSYFKRDDVLYVMAFIIDITDRKKAEQDFKRLNHELELKVEERTKVLRDALNELESSKEKLSKALEKEKELNEMKSRFVSMASHEFRTPLSAILSSASLIGKYVTTDENDKRMKHIQRIKSSVTNMTMLLNDFLSVGKIEEGKLYANPSHFDLEQLQREVVAELNDLKKEGQKIKSNYEGHNYVYLDKQMAKNIYLNLISNAIKFSPESSEIIVHTHVNASVIIQVSDQGIGIPEEEKEHLFERFFRARNAINIQGTGLGLSIVAKYVEYMHGTISFESKLNEGTTFKVILNNSKQNEDRFIN